MAQCSELFSANNTASSVIQTYEAVILRWECYPLDHVASCTTKCSTLLAHPATGNLVIFQTAFMTLKLALKDQKYNYFINIWSEIIFL